VELSVPVTIALFSCKINHSFVFHQVITTITVHELGTPGLKAILCVPFPYQKSAKVYIPFISMSSNFCTGFTLQLNLFSLLWF
jgi:voltage-dependent anion channel protein 2